MKRADTGINVGYAIVYECIRTITRIYPNPMLLDAAAASISRFIGSDNQNLKYFGVTALAQIVQDHPTYAAPHQMIVLDCLEVSRSVGRRAGEWVRVAGCAGEALEQDYAVAGFVEWVHG